MKKKPVSAPDTQKTTDAKTKRASGQPLLKRAVAAAKKVLSAKNGKKAPEAETEVDATTVVRRTYVRKKKTDVPAILLEGDAPAQMPASGPGEKFSLGATPPAQKFSGGELPEAYGTKKLFLTARDPHWLYAHWDLTREQQLELNGASTDGHLVLRIYAHKIEGHPLYEIHVHPESRHWFAHVERAGNSYAAELGYYSALGKWMRVAISSGTVTPPDAASKEDTAEFATIPFEIPFAKLIQIIEDAVRDNIPLAQAIEELRRHGHPDLPRLMPGAVAAFNSATVPPTSIPGPTRAWTPQQEQALSKIINIDQSRRIWMGSLEITELIRRRLSQDVTSPTTAYGISSLGLTSPTSPFGAVGGEKGKGFWFNVNAELIIYGATEPNAKVTLGGHEIKLRSDGTFSYRFALPDGKYDLPAVAVSASGDDARAADLKFVRETQYLGDVGATPQDPALKAPLADNV
ncbi:MAG: DUF4912 domain-containing protein [Verrucomicrobia bacterium]|nr:DUF4912 domain-containing protein [Verrucomicrobiota bacterium]